jgi:hypothetical protein
MILENEPYIRNEELSELHMPPGFVSAAVSIKLGAAVAQSV